MKNFLALLLGLFVSLAGNAQPCPPYGISFYSQPEVDNFQINYPDCTEIEGNVMIVGLDIYNLNGLSGLTSISGNLKIGDYYLGSTILKSFTGLDNLTSIGGNLVIWENDSLISLAGLENVTSIGGNLQIYHSDCLSSLTGLESLYTIGGSLDISYTHRLVNLAGLDNLTSIGVNLKIGANDSLFSLTGLENVTSIGGAILIDFNPQLNNIDGLCSITSCPSDVFIFGNEALTNLTGLSDISSVGGYLTIHSSSIISLEGLNNLISVGGDLKIIDNRYLLSLSALNNLTSIRGSLDIAFDSSLVSLKGLDNINADSITQLQIEFNFSLTDCAVYSICNYLASPDDSTKIMFNASGCNSPEEVDSACIYLSNDEVNFKPAFSVYPIPTSTQITITLPSTSPINNTTLSIYNVNAQQVISRRIKEPQTVIDISAFPQGIYFVRVATDKTVKVGKFVKQ